MTLTIGVLSWKSHETLRNTLTSYQAFGLDKEATQKIIFFQEISDEDRNIAKEYGWEWISSPTNIGIAEGYKRLVEIAEHELFMFLENDWILIDRPKYQLMVAKTLLRDNFVDVVRLRHRQFPGNPLYTRQFEGRELEGLTHLLDCVHWRDHPHKDFPQFISYSQGFYQARSPNANWTNNPTLFRTEFLRQEILPRMGSGDIEKDIQPWWQTQYFWVAQGEGLFMHNRLDR